jgi:hypothetical protein
MRKTLVTFGLVTIAAVTVHDIATFPRRTFGLRDVSRADNHEESVCPQPLYDEDEEEESGSGIVVDVPPATMNISVVPPSVSMS